MADNYVQFSTQITHITPDEAEWINVSCKGRGKSLRFDWRVWGLYESPRSAKGLGQCWWIYAEEWGSPEHAADMIQAFLKIFRPNGAHGFEWACTCSKPRLDEFNGGAVFVTAEQQEWMRTGKWLQQQRAQEAKGGIDE